MSRLEKVREELKGYGRLAFERQLVWGRSGNISARVGKDAFLISASGSELGTLNDDDLVLCRLDSEAWEGSKRPSIETGLHRGIYRTQGGARAILHSHPFYSTLVACSNIALRADLIPEAMAYLGKVGRVPYYHAGSRKLAEVTATKARDSQALLLENHGVVCWGSSLDDVLLKTETLELLCRLVVVASASGISLNYLGEETIEDFTRHLQRKK